MLPFCGTFCHCTGAAKRAAGNCLRPFSGLFGMALNLRLNGSGSCRAGERGSGVKAHFYGGYSSGHEG